MQMPKISGGATTVELNSGHGPNSNAQLPTIPVHDQIPLSAPTSSVANDMSSGNADGSTTLRNSPLHKTEQKNMNDQNKVRAAAISATSSVLDIGETSIDVQNEKIKKPLHLQISNLPCTEKDTTDESSGCGGMTSTSTSTSGNDSQSSSPRHLNVSDSNCINATKNDGTSHGKNPLKANPSMHTPELASIVPLSGTEHMSTISNTDEQKDTNVKRFVSMNSSSSASSGDGNDLRHEPISKKSNTPEASSKSGKDIPSTTRETKSKITRAESANADMCPNLPLAFTVDVASALDQVLEDLETDRYKKDKESTAGKKRPCVLQQTSIVDLSSSGTTSPCPDEGSIESGVADDMSTSSSVRVKSSMLVCEASLNMIAQMTAPPKQGRLKRMHGFSNVQNGETEEEEKLINSKATKIKCILNNIKSSDSVRKTPMITGTAAAQFEAMARNGEGEGDRTATITHARKEVSSSECTSVSKPLAPPPQLAPSRSALNSVPTNNKNDKVMVAGSAIEQDMKRSVKGMDMLADIISHAVPINGTTTDSKNASTNLDHEKKISIEKNMVPIGQSLSVYSAIAAQAGVATHTPTPLPTKEQVELSHEKSRPKPQLQTVAEPAPAPQKQTYIREIGKIRRFNAGTGEFSEWEDLPCQTYGDTEPRRWCELNIDESIEIPLRRGGRLRVFPNFVAEGRRRRVSESMDKSTLHRQYWKEGDKSCIESRTQVLLSSKVNRMHNGQSKKGRPGYQYDGVTMMAQPLSLVPHVERLGRDLAELYRLPDFEWNIGANLVCYRTGNDHMAWNSNCDQNEVLILCIVADSQNCTRPILIRPKGHDPLQEGDEEIIVFVGQGDAYEMDGQMQLSYEHCIPKKEDDMNAKRSVVVFRHGKSVVVDTDTGVPVFVEQPSVNPAGRASSVNFGHPVREIAEGKEVFTKTKLLETGAHRNERKLINGTMRDGCDSILVESQDLLLREDDGLCWLQTTCSKTLGGGSLSQCYHNKAPVRVFRSSDLESKYAPVLYEDEADTALYRYDGLYAVRAMWDTEGNETSNPPPNDGSQHTFLLTRYPKKPVDGSFEAGMHYNKISIHELWTEIQKRSGVRKPKLFQVPQPFMDLAPIGDQSNLSRKRKENIKLPSEENLKNRKARRKRKNAASPDLGYGHINISPYLPPRMRMSLSKSNSFTDSEVESGSDDNEQMDVEEDSDAGSTNRPKRASAAAARMYLQEAMQNKFGVGARDRPSRKRRPSIKLGYSVDERQSKHMKVLDDAIAVHSDMSEDDNNSTPEEDGSDREKLDLSDDIVTGIAHENDEVDVSAIEIARKTETKPAIIPKKNKRSYKRKQTKPQENKEVEDEKTLPKNGSLTEEKSGIDLTSIQVGNRVNVEYRDVLYKATVKRVRAKADSYEYQIHYDGNKKTNLRWIPSSMINGVISQEVVAENAEADVKKGRKASKKAKDVSLNVEKEAAKITVEVKEEPPAPEFENGSEHYVEYRKVLYVGTVRKSRFHKKGFHEYLVHYDGFKKTADRWVKVEALSEINDESTLHFNNQRIQTTSDVKKTRSTRQSSANETELGPRRSRGKVALRKSDSSIDSLSLDMSEHDSGVEFLPGSCVFVVRKDALYLAKMMKRKKVGDGMNYLVHFDSSTSDHDTWVPLSTVYEINPKTRRIFDRTEERRENMNEEEEEPEESVEETKVPAEAVSPTRTLSRRTSRKPSKYGQDNDGEDKDTIKKHQKTKKSTKPDHITFPRPADMTDIDSGCDFLPGSTIFVLWKNGLYLAKMLKRRGRGEHMEYLVHYDGFRQNQDAWVSVSLVYEINPQTKRAFSKQKKKF